jgi:hypothetical protein
LTSDEKLLNRSFFIFEKVFVNASHENMDLT